MPEMDGLELIEKIRQSATEYYQYIILLTSKSEKEDIIEGMELGADDFLSKPFDRDELRVRVRAGFRIIDLEHSLVNKNAEITAANDRMKSDLDAAARLQSSLLPSELPEIADTNFAWLHQPCDELAGDILNVFQLDQDHIGFYVADVSGHGVPAALLSISINQAMTPVGTSSLLLETDDTGARVVSPAEVAYELNRQFQMSKLDRLYFTLAYGVLNTKSLELDYITAGHPPILLSSTAGEIKPLPGKNLAIGWFPEAEFESENVQLHRGDRIYLYSDGITETMSPEIAQFGDQRFMELIIKNKAITLQEGIEDLSQAIADWRKPAKPRDDISLLAVDTCK